MSRKRGQNFDVKEVKNLQRIALSQRKFLARAEGCI
jgi:hypothetical protein